MFSLQGSGSGFGVSSDMFQSLEFRVSAAVGLGFEACAWQLAFVLLVGGSKILEIRLEGLSPNSPKYLYSRKLGSIVIVGITVIFWISIPPYRYLGPVG